MFQGFASEALRHRRSPHLHRCHRGERAAVMREAHAVPLGETQPVLAERQNPFRTRRDQDVQDRSLKPSSTNNGGIAKSTINNFNPCDSKMFWLKTATCKP